MCVWDLLGQGRPDGLTTQMAPRAGARHARAPVFGPPNGLGLAVFGRALYPDPGHCAPDSLLRVRVHGALPATIRTPSAPSKFILMTRVSKIRRDKKEIRYLYGVSRNS